jgi:hypothetical protein
MRVTPIVVNVDCTGHGTWDVGLPRPHGTVSCDGLDEAKRVARSWFGRGGRSVLVIRDAYLRVLQQELIDPSDDAAARHVRPRTAPLTTVI